MGLPIAHPYKLWLQCYTNYGSKNKFNSSMLARWSIIMSIRNIKRHWTCLCLDWLFGGWYCFSASKGNFLTFGLAFWIQVIRSGNFWKPRVLLLEFLRITRIRKWIQADSLLAVSSSLTKNYNWSLYIYYYNSISSEMELYSEFHKLHLTELPFRALDLIIHFLVIPNKYELG